MNSENNGPHGENDKQSKGQCTAQLPHFTSHQTHLDHTSCLLPHVHVTYITPEDQNRIGAILLHQAATVFRGLLPTEGHHFDS